MTSSWTSIWQKGKGFVKFAPLAGTLAVFLSAIVAWPSMVTKAVSTTYLPHGFCYLWNAQLVALHVISDSAIWLSYLAISGTLAYVVHRHRKQIPLSGIFVAFGTFIVACGFTHLMDVVVLWTPLYWLAGDLKLIAAVASVTTAIALVVLVPKLERVMEQVKSAGYNGRRFEAATNASLDSFFILDCVRDAEGEITDFRFSFMNTNGARLCSTTAEDLTGRLLCETFPVNRTHGFFELYKKVVETGESIIDEFSLDAEGINATCLRFQVVKLDDGVAINTSDISERKENEVKLGRLYAELAKTEQWFRGMIEASPNAMVMTDSSGQIEMINTEMEIVFGYSRAELLGKSIRTLVPERLRANPVPPRQGPPTVEALLPGDWEQFCGERKDGTEFPFEIRLKQVDMAGGRKVLSSIIDISDRRQKELRIEEALREKDLLLSEIHHRVKNNLQIVHSLLDLQSSKIDDPRVLTMVRDSQNRIRSMALIHQTLYQSKDFARVDFGLFLNSLAPTLIASYLAGSDRIQLSIESNDMYLPIDAAIPCGLLVNELLSNCLKHAFPEERRGSIQIGFVQNGEGRAELTVSDDGIGIPEDFDLTETVSLGLQLVFLLTDQIGGKMTVHRAEPTRFTLLFPLKEPAKNPIKGTQITHLPELSIV